MMQRKDTADQIDIPRDCLPELHHVAFNQPDPLVEADAREGFPTDAEHISSNVKPGKPEIGTTSCEVGEELPRSAS